MTVSSLFSDLKAFGDQYILSDLIFLKPLIKLSEFLWILLFFLGGHSQMIISTIMGSILVLLLIVLQLLRITC